MSKAREILDERLAKGEISIEEHAKLTEKLGKVDQQNLKPTEPAAAQTSTPPSKPFNIAKLWWVIPLVVIGIWFSSAKNNLVIEKLSADSPLFAATTVTAVVYNKGGSKQYSYHVEKGSSETPHCRGNFFIGENERRTIQFQCAALTNYTGKFRFETSTRN